MDVRASRRELTISPDSLSDRPESRLILDPITDVFNLMHVAGVVHARLEATAPWGLIREAERAHGSQLAHFGMVARGNCWLSVKGIPKPFPLAGGDCFLLAPGSAYSLRDS